ncbi:MAG: ATP-binding protein [Candidatus Omnitrophica bacterium]|nr:ATP-binding protein [Candidatus Omnitrophota bacterium]
MVDLELLKEQNPWWIAKEKIKEDVNIEKLSRVKYIWHPKVMDSFNLERDVIYTLRGSRQIGKSTTLKLLVERLLSDNQKENICYFTCNNIDNYKELIDILRVYLDWIENDKRKYIFIDEVTFVKSWTRAIKHLKDIGKLKNCTMILTGSNAHDLKYEVERMPGRRGEDAELDKILFPLSFKEYIEFVNPEINLKFLDIKSAQKNYPFYKKELRKYLDVFLLTGGFITAVNNFAANRKISVDIYQQYLSWVLGDLAKLGKRESCSRQIFEQVIKSMTTNIGFDTIAKKTSIDSHITVGDYLDVMESNFIVKLLYQIDMNKKLPVFRRTKKIYFQDMFLFWVFLGYVNGLSDYYSGSKTRLNDVLLKSKLIENLVMTSLMRLENSVNWSNIVFFFRTTNQAEVDFVIKGHNSELLPIEVKYQDKVSLRDFLNLNKINKQKGIIISKDDFWVQKDKWIIPVEVFLLIWGDCLKS